MKTGIYTYSVSCEGYFPKTNQNLGVLEDQVVNVSLDKKLYVEFVVTPTDAVVVMKNGSGEILTPESANTYAVKEGMYSYSVTRDGYKSVENVSFVITNAEETKEINVTLQDASIYGVRRQINNSSTAWERIAAGVGLVANATKSGGTVQNDFDNIPPWKDIKTCDLSPTGIVNKYIGDAGFSFTNPTGRIMTEIPDFWWQRKQENGYEYIYISSVEQEGFTKSSKCYLGRYTATGSSSSVTCKSGASNFVNVNMTSARTYSRNIGDGWGVMDVWRWSILEMLYLVEYADYNSQEKLGYGVCNGSQINTGGCDSLGMKSGCLGNDKKKAVIYRGIENPFGNIFQWLDGINISSKRAWVCRNRDSYASDKVSSPYVQLGYADASSNGYAKKVGYDPNYPEVQRATETGGSDSTYIPDYFNSYSSTVAVYVGGSYSYDLYCGLWFWYYHTSSLTGSNVGFRLLFIPV